MSTSLETVKGRGGGPGQGRLRTEATACPLRVVVRWGHGHRGQSSMDDPSGTHYTPPVHNDLEARRTRSSGQKEVRPETKPTPRTRAITPPDTGDSDALVEPGTSWETSCVWGGGPQGRS